MTLNNDEKYKFWNYLIPLHSNEKSFRSCNRELSKGCIVQVDIQYEIGYMFILKRNK